MVQSTIRATGSMPFASSAARSPTRTKAAPSVTPLELPGVTCPPLRKTGFRVASFSSVISGRGNSSSLINRVPLRPSGTSIGAI